MKIEGREISRDFITKSNLKSPSEVSSREVSEIEIQLNSLEREIKNLEHSFILKDLKKFNETKNNLIIIQKKIKVLIP